MSKKFLDLDGLSHLWLLITNKLKTKVDKEFKTGSTSAYKVLSDNNLTDELVTKIQNAGDSSFSGNYEDLVGKPNLSTVATSGSYNDLINKPTIPDKTSQLANDSGFLTEHQDISHLAPKTSIPTNNNQLANGAGYQTLAEVQTAIGSALSNITGIDFQVVTELPISGVKGTIYLLSNSGSNPNSYDEYIYVNNKWEKIGTTDVDLSGYLKDTDVIPITNSEIDETCT